MPAFNGTLPWLAMAMAMLAAGCGGGRADDESAVAKAAQAAAHCEAVSDEPVRISGGKFPMGQESVYAEEGPVRETTVDEFLIDPHEVTVAQFSAFVAATKHVTRAEMPVDPSEFGVPRDQIPPDLLLPGSAVFVAPDRSSTRYEDWWKYIPGANWKKPYGPNGPNAQPRDPVVHLAYEDMLAYAEWRGGRLPTEAEWEYAAHAGQPTRDEQPAAKAANSWQGVFPLVNEEADNFYGVAPVGCFTPNPWGLYDMVGNVWEMTSDFYRDGHDPSDRVNPKGPREEDVINLVSTGMPRRVIKGGSYLCAPNYCRRYRPAARQDRDPGLGTSNVGFRLVYDVSRAP